MPNDDDGEGLLLHYMKGHHKGSERDLLDIAKSLLPDPEYQGLEHFLKQGYAEQSYVRTMVAEVHREWCLIFNRPCIDVYRHGPFFQDPTQRIRIDWSLHDAVVVGPTTSQVEQLVTLGWCVGSARIARLDQSKPVETSIKQALDILGLPFHRGLPPPNPPVMSRYERLMATDLL